MGASWYGIGISDERLIETEKAVFKFSGVEEDLICAREVRCDEAGNFMRTLFFGDKKKPKFVLIHGYGGSGVIFYKIVGKLCEYFQVIAVDILGMGASSRPQDVTYTTASEADDYFLAKFDFWLQEMELEQFYLLGHSYGGYLAGKLACRHPDKVLKLFLASSAGVGSYPNFDFDADWAERVEKGQNLPPASFVWVVRKAWNQQLTPNSMLRFMGPFGSHFALRRSLNRRFHVLPQEERDALGAYFPQILLKPQSTDHCLHLQFQCFMRAVAGLEDRDLLPAFPNPVVFIYGDHDWMRMDIEGAFRVKQLRHALPTSLHTIPNCGHHLYIDNPDHFADTILSELEEVTH